MWWSIYRAHSVSGNIMQLNTSDWYMLSTYEKYIRSYSDILGYNLLIIPKFSNVVTEGCHLSIHFWYLRGSRFRSWTWDQLSGQVFLCCGFSQSSRQVLRLCYHIDWIMTTCCRVCFGFLFINHHAILWAEA